MIKDNDVKYVDLRFTDPRGKWQHVTFDIALVDEEMFAEGTMFDGSSIAGWKAINESDMILMPDPTTAHIDPFFAEPDAGHLLRHRSSRRPASPTPRPARHRQEGRSLSEVDRHRRHRLLRPGSRILRVRRRALQGRSVQHGLQARLDGLPTNSDTELRGRQPRPPHPHQGRLLPGPADRLGAGHARRDALGHGEMGCQGREAPPRGGLGPARTRHEVRHADDMADHMQIYKYCIHRSRTSTARPRPSCRSRSSATTARACTSTSRSGRAASRLFAGNKYADLSETCLYYIGGIIKHAKALNAFTNPSTNSYKRLVPGYEAPVLLAYSARNRSASCRIPYTTRTRRPSASRSASPIRWRTPTSPSPRMLMAGLDGIKNKIDPGPAMDKDLYDLPPEGTEEDPDRVRLAARSARSLDKDRAFLKAGGVFDDDMIDMPTSS
jgi:glutamine synthetase